MTAPAPSPEAPSEAMILTDAHIQPKTNNPDHGVMDIGKNCAFCNQLDFLPFVCEYCKGTFCEQHRRLEAHQCKHLNRFLNQGGTGGYRYQGPLVKLLFPDANARKFEQERQFERSQLPVPVTIKQKLGTKAMAKFQRFIDSNLTLGKLRKQSAVSLLVSLKKAAKGDAKIQPSDRVYVWTLYVDGDLSSINADKARKPMFLLKKWPVGRALDVIADEHKITNYNNSTLDSDARLNIFRLDKDKPVTVSTSERCAKLTNGDTLYLVRGPI